MTTHPFSKAAVEAAAKAACEEQGQYWEASPGHSKSWWLEVTSTAISAAFEHARGEGYCNKQID